MEFYFEPKWPSLAKITATILAFIMTKMITVALIYGQDDHYD